MSDLDFKMSGYFNLTIPLCTGLSKLGHEIKVLGLSYHGEQHDYPFSIVPTRDFNEALATVKNMHKFWGFDLMIVALDIPMQEQFLMSIQGKPFKYFGIMPVEADPLCMDWAMVLMMMDKQFIISEFGTNEATKLGVPATYLPVGIDSSAWRIPTKEERSALRASFGLDENDFVILTVADNQERKNLGKALEIVAEFSKGKTNVKYVLVTREHCPVGWKLRTLAQTYGINKNLLIFERGMPFKELWSMYAVADCFMLTSKTEGLGMPLMEAMSCGVPCVATNATGMKELLSDDKGLLADYEYTYVDPFGNGNRYFIDTKSAVCQLEKVYNHECQHIIDNARTYIENRPWDDGISRLNLAIEEIKKNEQKAPTSI